MTVSPFALVMAVAYNGSEKPEQFFTTEMWNSCVAEGVRQEFRDEGFLDEDDRGTDKLRVWVDALCKTPMPVRSWVVAGPF